MDEKDDLVLDIVPVSSQYSVMQLDGNSCCGDVVKKASRDRDNILDQIYAKRNLLVLFS